MPTNTTTTTTSSHEQLEGLLSQLGTGEAGIQPEQISLARQVGQFVVGAANYVRKNARSITTTGSLMTLTGFVGAGAASAQEIGAPVEPNPNRISIEESRACMKRVLSPTNVLSMKPRISSTRRGITFTGRFNLDDECVTNSFSLRSRLHGAGDRIMAPVYRLKKRGSKKYGDWIMLPSIIDPDSPRSAAHKGRLQPAADGMRTIGTITSQFRVPKIGVGTRVQAGTFMRFRGRIDYGQNTVDPLDGPTGQPIPRPVGSSVYIPGTSVKVTDRRAKRLK